MKGGIGAESRNCCHLYRLIPNRRMTHSLQAQFGPIDIYLFDQILKGRLHPGHRILDLGCGAGRNLVYFLRQGYAVQGVDLDAEAIDKVRDLARTIQPDIDLNRFRVARIEDLPFDPSSVDLVMLNAVLHFARDADHFDAMVNEAWRVLAPGGIFFARLASNIGIQDKVQHLGNGRFLLPDGTERYLVDQRMLLKTTRDLDAELIEPIETTLVQELRSMTTWVMRKSEA